MLKARLCVHGNRDAERESLRTDAAVVSHDGFRFLYSASVCFGMILGKADIRGAYTQSGEARREVYVQPPREMEIREELWLLTATMYGIVSAGRNGNEYPTRCWWTGLASALYLVSHTLLPRRRSRL